MHLLYVDDSGSVGNPQEKHFVLGGVAVFERGIYHVIKALDDIVEGFGLGGSAHDIELHGTDMYGGRCAPWRQLQRAERERFLSAALLHILRGHGGCQPHLPERGDWRDVPINRSAES
jgi:hypothetical protein